MFFSVQTSHESTVNNEVKPNFKENNIARSPMNNFRNEKDRNYFFFKVTSILTFHQTLDSLIEAKELKITN